MTARLALLLLVVLGVSCGTSSNDPNDSDLEAAGPDTADAIDDGKLDSTELRVRTGVTTLWVDKVTAADVIGDSPRLTIHGRTSRDLASVFSWVPDDAFGTANVVSQRKFTVVLDEGHEINTLLSGLPIHITIDTKTGTPSHYTARLRLAARLAGFKGSSTLHPSTVIDPIYVRAEDTLRYRGSIRTDSPAISLAVSTDEDADPSVVPSSDPLRWGFDWTYASLATAAFPAGDTVTFQATTGGSVLEKLASFEFRVLGLSMTTKDPALAWPEPECAAAVTACIQQTPSADLGGCGSYREVLRCMHAPVVDASRLVTDLASHLVGYYAAHGADIAMMGGNTLEQAQQAILLEQVEELADPADDPHAHDFETTVVLSHPDVVFPGSDRVWYGAYDRASGELLEVYDFN